MTSTYPFDNDLSYSVLKVEKKLKLILFEQLLNEQLSECG